MYKTYCILRDSKGYKDSDVARITGITKSTFSDWKSGRSNPKNDKLQKIADCLGVTVDYLMTGKETEEKSIESLTAKDKRDIKRNLDKIMGDIVSGKDSPLYYGDIELDEASLELLRDSIELALKRIKPINKEKYNPNKNKK